MIEGYKIEFQTTDWIAADKDGKEETQTYAKLAMTALDSPPPTGLKLDDMTERLDVYDKVKVWSARNPILELTKSELQKLIQCIKDCPWAKPKHCIVDFANVLEDTLEKAKNKKK